MTTLTALLLGDVNNPSPRITYYDDATGERIELSTVTLANWAAKTANMLRDEFGAGPGSTVAVRLPAHWQTAGVLLGIWWAGAELVFGDASTDGLIRTLDARAARRRRSRRARCGGVSRRWQRSPSW
ncbi:TIGR03089 family protein [Mycobacteroides abscessus]|nr:TIGR03089 family protein [Mycobacteroides abscessus]